MRAARVFKSEAIARRRNSTTIETADGFLIRIGRLLNFPRTLQNGFSQEVCDCFEFGFPIEWEKLANPNMAEMNGHPQSPSQSTANAPSASVEYYMEKFSRASVTDLMGYAFTGNDFNSSRSPPTQRFSSLSNGNTRNGGSSMRKMPSSERLGDGRMDMPEGPLTPPAETCSGDQTDGQHGNMQTDASQQGIVNHSISSVLANQSTISICSYSNGDGNTLAPSKIVSVEKEGYKSRVGCSHAEKGANIQHEKHSCSSQQEMVTHPVDSALVNNYMTRPSSDFGEPGTPKCGKTSANLGPADALEVPLKGMTPQFGAVQGSEDNTVRRLRSGKVFGGSVLMEKSYNKRKRMQQKDSNPKMVPCEGVTPTADLNSHKNGCLVAGIVAADELQSHDSHNKGSEGPAKRRRGRSAKRAGRSP
uniref:SANTA domain-containing protein n=1 Tax=Arundo donax TaxID=35708 RepID=A0A0A9CQ81_ARUDO